MVETRIGNTISAAEEKSRESVELQNKVYFVYFCEFTSDIK